MLETNNIRKSGDFTPEKRIKFNSTTKKSPDEPKKPLRLVLKKSPADVSKLTSTPGRVSDTRQKFAVKKTTSSSYGREH
jgi:hypothetical protein